VLQGQSTGHVRIALRGAIMVIGREPAIEHLLDVDRAPTQEESARSLLFPIPFVALDPDLEGMLIHKGSACFAPCAHM
jgi:hypothetical protein